MFLWWGRILHTCLQLVRNGISAAIPVHVMSRTGIFPFTPHGGVCTGSLYIHALVLCDGDRSEARPLKQTHGRTDGADPKKFCLEGAATKPSQVLLSDQMPDSP